MLEIIQSRTDSVILSETFSFEISSIVNSLKNNNNILLPTKFLRLCIPVISANVATLFNACLNIGLYPNCLKNVNVTPIFKKGDRSEPGNYRPISVLNDLNKIYEELIYSRLINYLDNKSILTNTQYGFRKHRSTQEACIDLVNSLITAYRKKQYALCSFINFRKAFDSIDHNRLLLKLERYGIRGNILSLFSSYLFNRKQRVLLDGESSDLLTIKKRSTTGIKTGPDYSFQSFCK